MTSTLDHPDLFQRREAKEKASVGEQADVIRTLRNFATYGQRWVKAKDIIESLGLPDCVRTRRKLRKVAEANRKRIITGDKGYCLLSQATLKEVARASRRLLSQGRKMVAAGIATRAAYYRFMKEGEE